MIAFIREGLALLTREFHEVGGFPNVIGAIDGTHVEIKGPNNEEQTFVNRKGSHSINVMVFIVIKSSILYVHYTRILYTM